MLSSHSLELLLLILTGIIQNTLEGGKKERNRIVKQQRESRF